MQIEKIVIIGAGNMGSALLSGLIHSGFQAENIFITDPDSKKLNILKEKYHIHIESNNLIAAEKADVILFAVKPQQLTDVAKSLAPIVQKNRPLIISIAAGVSTQQISQWLSQKIAVVRCMPNTPALIGAGISALFANENVTKKQCEMAETILNAVGKVIWLTDEKLLNAVTALSGSGPAYFFLVMEALQKAGEALGLPRETAHLLTIHTALGAARLALESNSSVEELRHRVTSPGGTTESALRVLKDGKLVDLFYQAVVAACQRADELTALGN